MPLNSGCVARYPGPNPGVFPTVSATEHSIWAAEAIDRSWFPTAQIDRERLTRCQEKWLPGRLAGPAELVIKAWLIHVSRPRRLPGPQWKCCLRPICSWR
jgi:hypothetical protein